MRDETNIYFVSGGALIVEYNEELYKYIENEMKNPYGIMIVNDRIVVKSNVTHIENYFYKRESEEI